MPSPAGPETNQYRCEACGRYFNEEDEFREHRRECAAIKHTGSGDMRENEGRSPEQDREWTSKP